MLNTLVALLILSAAPQVEIFKKEAHGLQRSVEEAVNSAVPGPALLQKAKATYLEGYGVVVTLEVALEPPPNPFSNPKSPAELRKLVNDRKAVVRERFEALMKQRTAALQSLGATDSLAIVIHLFNPNPAALPNLPSQLVFTAKKQAPTQVSYQEQ